MRSTCFITLLLVLAGCAERYTEVFSSRASPDGSVVAESVMIGIGGDGAGQLLVRHGTGSESRIEFTETEPGLFLVWTSDRDLEVWREREKPDEPNPLLGKLRNLGEVRIVAKSFDFPRDIAGVYSRTSPNLRRVAVSPGKVVGGFVERAVGTARRCILTIGTVPDPSYDRAEVEINVGVTPACAWNRPCAGISSRFTLEEGSHLSPQVTLTSATVSDIPSYNRLPTGSDGTSVRGQFLEESALALLDAIKSGSVSLDFSRNFFTQVIRYELPLSEVAAPVRKFQTCLGDADVLWARHLRRERAGN